MLLIAIAEFDQAMFVPESESELPYHPMMTVSSLLLQF